MLNLHGAARQHLSARINLHPRGTCIICALGFCPIDRESRFSTLPSYQKPASRNRKFLWRAISAARPVTLPTRILTVFPPLLHHSCCKQGTSNSAGSLLSTCQLELSFRIM